MSIGSDSILPSLSLCQVCGAMAPYLDSVDLNKSCEDSRGKPFPANGVQVGYFLCDRCGFCFAPTMQAWTPDLFTKHIYNEDYVRVDPAYESSRPDNNFQVVEHLFASGKGKLSHLDYGGGSGLLSGKLRSAGWDSRSYDPFVNKDQAVTELGKFDLVTAFEVFEHVPDLNSLLEDLRHVCKPNGMLLFSTLLSDSEIVRGRRLTWWYAAPRNGHISLFSTDSLSRFLAKNGLSYKSLSAGLHLAFRQ